MYHEIEVPREHRSGRGAIFVPSMMERYIEMYERAWWACMEDYALNIDHQYTDADVIANGWPAAIDGYTDGYIAADARIRKLLRFYDKKTVQAFLLEETTLNLYPPEGRVKNRYEH